MISPPDNKKTVPINVPGTAGLNLMLMTARSREVVADTYHAAQVQNLFPRFATASSGLGSWTGENGSIFGGYETLVGASCYLEFENIVIPAGAASVILLYRDQPGGGSATVKFGGATKGTVDTDSAAGLNKRATVSWTQGADARATLRIEGETTDFVRLQQIVVVTAAGTGPTTDTLPWWVGVPVFFAERTVGTWSVTISTGYFLGTRISNNSQATGDKLTIPVHLGAGTWAMDVIHFASTTTGDPAAAFSLGGASIGTVNMSATNGDMVKSTISGFSYAGGLEDLTITASAAKYVGTSWLQFRRTA